MLADDKAPAPAQTTPLVSVLIVNYNGAKLLKDCLDSLRLVTYPRFEVVVVDNASKDDSLSVLATYPQVRVVQSDSNRGFAGGNNLGVECCQGEYILLLNNDTIVTPDFLTILVEYITSHPQVGIVQAKMTLPLHENRLDTCGSYLTALGFLYHYGYYKPDQALYERPQPVFSAKGACMLFPKDLIRRAGGHLFDEDFFCYYEETDFCHRCWLTGYEVHFVPQARIQHLQGATANQVLPSGRALQLYLANQTTALLSNLGFWSAVRIMPCYFAVLLASMLASLVTGKIQLFKTQVGSLIQCAKNLKKLRARRKIAASIRMMTDAQIFDKVMRTPRWGYFIKTFSGKLADYQDQPLSNR